MRQWQSRIATGLIFAMAVCSRAGAADDELAAGFASPPPAANTRVYWWWINSHVTKEAITRDLEEMKAKGIGGALIFDAGQPAGPTPAGPVYLSAAWRELFRHAVREAARTGIELSLNIQSGWNLGGPMVPPAEASEALTWSEAEAAGPKALSLRLALPPSKLGFYRDIAVLAYKGNGRRLPRKPIERLRSKASFDEFGGSVPDTTPLITDAPDRAGEEDTHSKDVLDLTKNMLPDGTLDWDAPPGRWHVLRLGATCSGAKVSTGSPGWDGPAIDYLNPEALRSYWHAAVDPLLADAGPVAGTALKYLHTDSWELGGVNWTPRFAEEFRARRGYDLRPFLPVVAGRILDSRSISNRFLNDFRRTIGDLVVENNYRLMADLAHAHGMGIHPESGGPHAAPVDALKALGQSDVPMMEFTGGKSGDFLDYLHRRDSQTDIYFISNRLDHDLDMHCIFRVGGKLPELWDPVTAERRDATLFKADAGRTEIPLHFAPFGSRFVVFRKPLTANASGNGPANDFAFSLRSELAGAWTVTFPPGLGAPASAEFPALVSWTERPEPGIKFFSGTATYHKALELPESLRGKDVVLSLGKMKNVATVGVNGQNLGVVWAFPFAVEITRALKPGENQLEIDVTNLWANRLLGDASLPPQSRVAKTTVRTTKKTKLLESGLLGPVELQATAPGANAPP